MPIFVQFPQQNTPFGKPQEWEEENCGTLWTWKGHHKFPNGDIVPRIISAWEFTEAEWAILSETRRVWLSLFSTGICPIGMQVNSPFETEKDSLL